MRLYSENGLQGDSLTEVFMSVASHQGGFYECGVSSGWSLRMCSLMRPVFMTMVCYQGDLCQYGLSSRWSF